jgi:DNA-directed RNA polymerase specialized sigma24 family protein
MRELSKQGREALSKLTDTGRVDLYKRLRFYAYRNFSRKVQGRFDLLDEVIQEAIVDTYFGKRHLPPDVDLTAFLCETVRSKVSHILEKEKNKISIEEVEEAERQTSYSKSIEASIEGSHLENSYQVVVYKELCNGIRKAVRSDPSLLELAELLFAVPDLKPREIAMQMNQPINNVFNLLRRLRRRARKL